MLQLPGPFFDQVGKMLVLVTQHFARRLQLQMGGHPGRQRDRIDGLRNIVDGAFLETTLFVHALAFGGQEDDRDVGGSRIRLQLAAYRIAVHLRHHHVQQNEIGASGLPGNPHRVTAIVGELDLIAVLQQFVHQHQIVWCVIHD
jgi:hypothetical protein